MVTLPHASTVSQSSLETLTSNRDQRASEPRVKEVLIPKELPPLPPLEGEIAFPSTGPVDDVVRKPLSPLVDMSGSITSLVVGFVAGVALAISHHIFLTFLNGRNIDEYPQYWVKNANNAFSAIFSFCIVFFATSALIQMKWYLAGSKPLSIRSIDNLFALPSPFALFTTVTSTRMSSLKPFLPPILAAVFIQSLSLVSVFAPNALMVAPSAEISQHIQVKTLDLSTGTITSTELWGFSYGSASQEWTTVLTSIMLQTPLLNWKIPPACGAACKFDLVYEGPGLQCMDTPLEPLPYTPPYTEQPYTSLLPLFYNATSTLYENPGVGSSFWEIEDQYELRIGYITTDDGGFSNGRNGGSVYCVFRNATYKASFQVENNTMQANHTLQSYGGILGTVKYGESDFRCSRDSYSPCFINGVNTRAMCDVFASAFTGKMQFNNSVLQVIETTGGVNVAVTDLLFSHRSVGVAFGFHLGVSNLSESLVSLFSNLTLGFIATRNDTTTVQAELWDGSYAWSYTIWILWAVYLPSLLLASLVILDGLLSIRSNKRVMDDKFSNFLLATRNTELDDVCMAAKDLAELQRFRLVYGREGAFSVASSGEYAK